jgi:hypothetical protein
MKKVACQYAIVRFVPFVETGEFANVGIIMIAPKNRFFGFELEIKRYARITNFFEEIESTLYKKTLNNLKEELERVAGILKQHGFDKHLKDNDIDFANGIFNEIVRTRETIIRFGGVRTVLTDKPKEKLRDLFAFYVERNFVTKQYQETLLEKGVRKILHEVKVGEKFIKDRVGDDTYHVNFPFVEHINHKPHKVIKPLHLGHDDSTKIYDHGASWIFRINKLKDHYLEPKNVLFALSGPGEDENRLEAYHDIERQLVNTGIHVTTCDNKDEIVKFALN